MCVFSLFVCLLNRSMPSLHNAYFVPAVVAVVNTNLDFNQCVFLVFPRAEKTEVLSDDLLQVNH